MLFANILIFVIGVCDHTCTTYIQVGTDLVSNERCHFLPVATGPKSVILQPNYENEIRLMILKPYIKAKETIFLRVCYGSG